MKNLLNKLLLAGAMAGMMGAAAYAATATNTFQARITIQADCEVTSPTDLDFGPSGLINNNIDATATFNVKCTNGTGYTIDLGDGANASGTQNRMTNGTEFVNYETYQDSARTQLWDAANTVTATGTGVDQAYTVYGRVPPQATPGVGNYTDTVTITVTY